MTGRLGKPMKLKRTKRISWQELSVMNVRPPEINLSPYNVIFRAALPSFHLRFL